MIDVSRYSAPRELSLTNKIVHFLIWARDSAPGEYVPESKIAQAIHGYAKPPNANTREVELIKRRRSIVRRILHAGHSCGIAVRPKKEGGGIRATVDSEDLLKTEVPACAVRYASAARALGSSAAFVDAKSVPRTTLENRQYVSWFTELQKGGGGLTGRLADLARPEFQQRWLPPSARLKGANKSKARRAA